MSAHSELMYQGLSRRNLLSYLHRLCITHYRDDLLARLCTADPSGPMSATAVSEAVVAWNGVLQRELEIRIRRSQGDPSEPAKLALSLLFDIEGQARVLSAVAELLWSASRKQNLAQFDQLLWNVLSEHFKDKMDQLDSFGDGLGTHQLQVMRRLDRLRRTLEEQHGPYADKAELAADLLLAIQHQRLSNMPGTVRTIMEYLYLLDSEYQVSLDDDTRHIPLVAEIIAEPAALIQLEQCLERLTEEGRQALSIKHGLGHEPTFLREQDFKQHYGFGWETLRKRAATAEQSLADCLLGAL